MSKTELNLIVPPALGQEVSPLMVMIPIAVIIFLSGLHCLLLAAILMHRMCPSFLGDADVS